MSLRFTVLASGSGGNASLVEAGGFGILIDAGIGPRTLAQRLAAVGASWRQVHALVLTHTHSDHWKDTTLAHLARRGIPVYCHADHDQMLSEYSNAFVQMQEAHLVHFFDSGEEFQLSPGLRCRPLGLRHDSGATFGFRFEGAPNLFGHAWAIGYLADLGCWGTHLVEAMADVDLLALEFNHDVELERASGRMPQLIARVLGDEGHLSNAQAAEFLRQVLRRSGRGRLRHLVQLHLSRECNRPALAIAAAQAALDEASFAGDIITACQNGPSDSVHLGVRPSRRRPARSRRAPTSTLSTPQILLPGIEAV